MYCQVEMAAGKLRSDYDASLFSANKLAKTKGGELDNYGTNKGGRGGMEDKSENQNASDYILPDGSRVNISSADKTRAPEILFRPNMIGLEYPGVHELVINCIKACDIDLRGGLQSSIVVAGSTTMMKSFCGRLHKSI